MPAGYGAVLVDQPVERDQYQLFGAVLHDNAKTGFAATLDSHLVVLSHPAESSILKSTGFTWDDLRREGRYVACTNVVCEKCGQLFSLKRLAIPQGCSGCLIPLVVAMIAGLTIGFWQESFFLGWFVACGVGYLSTCILDAKARHNLKSYFPERAAKMEADRHCPKCGAEDHLPITSAEHARCQVCEKGSLSFRIVGKS